jgi:hypothetical protein
VLISSSSDLQDEATETSNKMISPLWEARRTISLLLVAHKMNNHRRQQQENLQENLQENNQESIQESIQESTQENIQENLQEMMVPDPLLLQGNCFIVHIELFVLLCSIFCEETVENCTNHDSKFSFAMVLLM